MNKDGVLKVAVLVDLLRSLQAGGQVKCWERLAAASASGHLPLDLTVYFSGRMPDETHGPHTRLRHLPPVFSTANLKFLPYVPEHTDMAFYHFGLARELAHYDVIHTTDGFFAFARTAAHVSRTRNIPLVNSFHTDTPSYARLFTRQTIETICGASKPGVWLARKLIEDWQWPERQGRAMERKLRRHLRQCRYALVSRAEDRLFAENSLGRGRVRSMRGGIDKKMFNPQRRDRAGIERDYQIPPGRIVVLFVGRVDIGKNIHTLIGAMEKLTAAGRPLHLVVAGMGPAVEDVKARLGSHASVPGFVTPAELARLYASADVLAVPSEVETQSMAAAEGVASGCPVLIAGTSGIGKLFNGTPAIGIVEGGIESWAAALGDFAAQPRLQNAMRAATADYTRDEIAGWDEVLAEDFLTVWQEAAGCLPQQRAAA